MRYSEEVLNRVREPKRVGTLDGEHVGTGEVGTLDEGTVVRIQVRKSGNRIAEARFKVFGCSAAIASASLVAEWLEGAAIDEARQVTPERVVQALDLPAERHHVARMAVEAGVEAVEDIRLRGVAASAGQAEKK
jgi:nitrogen fixation NifU-like protein